MIHSIVMITDVAPNVIFRSFFFEFPWAPGLGALACYVFGLSYTLADSSKVIYDAWIRMPILIDACCVMVLFLPVVSNNICSIAAGFFAAQGN
ncbi:hypothetical protein BCR43DRAFT_490433, partial [Syncephalastrum racemosum]